MDKPLWGLRVDGPSGRRFLRGLSLTRPTAVRVQRLWCPGSEGSEGSACLWQAGSKGGGIALRAMSFIARLAGTGLHWRPPPPPLRGPPPPASGGRQGLRAQSSPPCYLPTPLSGSGWRAQRDGRGRPYGPLCGPGSEGSEGSACLWQAGSKGGGIALRAMSFIARLAGIGLHWRPPPSTTSWSPSPASGGRQGLRAQSSPPCYLPTPFRGWVASAARRKGAALPS